MSTQTQNAVTVECKYPDCNEHGNVWEFHHGDYCSNKCELKHRGLEAIAPLKFDHTYCFTCLTQLKEIEPPKPDHAFDESGTGWAWDEDEEWWTVERYGQETTREAAVGFQYTTPDAGYGEKESTQSVITGTICDYCGNTDHTAHVPLLAEGHETVGRVVDLLDDVVFSVQEFHREYVESGDLELALGRSISDERT